MKNSSLSNKQPKPNKEKQKALSEQNPQHKQAFNDLLASAVGGNKKLKNQRDDGGL